ncbi:MAG TPA: Ig-like domain-containing protein [Thermoflexales bacterium]|nr:Ig-like domain-containing protein [Thermoflexales bacterium]
MLIALAFALLLCLGFFVRCGGTPAAPVATAVPPVAATVAPTAKPAATAIPATAVPATVAPTAAPIALPKINLPKINLPALPILAGAVAALEGTGDPNTKYNVYDGDKQVGTVTTDASGKWKFELPKLSVGDHSIKLVPLGADGKEVVASAASVVLSVKEAIATAIAALPKINLPKINLPALPVLAGVASTIEGTGDPNTKYNVYDGDKVIGTVTTDASGKWKFELPKLSAGDHSIKLVPLGADGKEVVASAASVVLSVKEAIATAIAALPKINPPKINVPGVNGAVTAVKPGVLDGTGDPNTKYTIYDGDKAIGTVTTDASGKWKFEMPDLAVGNHVIKLVPLGADGKEVPASAASVNVSATAAAAPAAIVPSITPLKGDTVSQGGIIRGKGEPGSTVAIYDGDKEVGTAKVDAKGNWEWKVPLDYALGDHNLKVATKGADGKLGAFSPVYKVKVIGPVTLPVTGDESPAQPIWVMALLALGALAVGVSARKLNTTRR